MCRPGKPENVGPVPQHFGNATTEEGPFKCGGGVWVSGMGWERRGRERERESAREGEGGERERVRASERERERESLHKAILFDERERGRETDR